MHAVLGKCHYFRNDDPTDIKPTYLLHMVCTRLCAKFRHRMTRRSGGDRPRQNKQTLKYLVDSLSVPIYSCTSVRDRTLRWELYDISQGYTHKLRSRLGLNNWLIPRLGLMTLRSQLCSPCEI